MCSFIHCMQAQSHLASNCEGLLEMLTRAFDSAIRGFHYYRKQWSPKIEKDLIYSPERNIAFDIFAIKACKEDGEIVGHLPRELLRTLNTSYYITVTDLSLVI